MKRGRSAIALLITLMFVIVITVAIGYGLGQVNAAAKVLKEDKFLYQSNLIVEDVLTILGSSQLIQDAAKTRKSFFQFMSEATFIPFEYEGMKVLLEIKSARSKFNPAMLDEHSGKLLRQYLNKYNINAQYVDILEDNIRGTEDNNSYNSTIFDENPSLFRDYIASAKHLEIINDYYAKEFNDNSLKNVNFDELFYYSSKETNSSIDLNYATSAVWEFMLGCSKERADELNAGGGSYADINSVNLTEDEKVRVEKFEHNYFSPIIAIELEISINKEHSKVSFEYDIKKKEGSNFAY